MRGEVRHKKPRLAACDCLIGEAPLSLSEGNWMSALPTRSLLGEAVMRTQLGADFRQLLCCLGARCESL